MNQTNITLRDIKVRPGYTGKVVLALITSVQTVYHSQDMDYLAHYGQSRQIQPAPAGNLRPTDHGVYATVAGRRIVVGELEFLRQSRIKDLPADTSDQSALGVAVNGKLVGVAYFSHQSIHQNKTNRTGIIVVVTVAILTIMILVALSHFVLRWF